MQVLFANNAGSTLAGAITNTATTANLQAGTGALFPNPSAGQFFALTFTDALTGLVHEIVYVTARSGDALTFIRAQEGTTAQAWSAGDLAENLLTAGTMIAVPGLLLGVLTPATGSITLPTGTNKIIVDGVGGGGGSGSAPATTGSQTAGSAGGGSGAWGSFEVTTLTSLAATIGAAGIAGIAGAGGNGGNTVLTGTFGTITWGGGMGSPEGVITTGAALQGGGSGGAVPTYSGATLIDCSAGEAGKISLVLSGTNAASGEGGGTPYGAGGAPVGGSSPGTVGNGWGAGAGGALNLPSQSAVNGAPGTAGGMIIRCYT